jgi:hypothetical protein
MPAQRPMTDKDREDVVATRVLAQRLVDTAGAERQRLIKDGVDPDSADEIVTNAAVMALTTICPRYSRQRRLARSAPLAITRTHCGTNRISSTLPAATSL